MPVRSPRLPTRTAVEAEDTSPIQHVLKIVLRAFAVLTAGLLGVVPFLFAQSQPRPVIVLGLILLATLGLYYLNQSGKSRLASGLFVSLIWVTALILSLNGGGVRVPAFDIFLLPALLAYLLLGQRTGTAIILLTIVTGGLLLYAETYTALLPPLPIISSEWSWISHIAILIAAAWLFNVATRNLRDSLIRSRQQEHLLHAVIESTTNGILVIGLQGEVITANQRFLELWNLSESWIHLPGRETGLSQMAEQTDNPSAFLARSRDLLEDYSVEATDFIELKHGVIVQRHARPYIVDHHIIGRIYTYLDVTEQIRSEQALIFYSEFKSLITSISTEFINLPMKDIDAAIGQTLRRIGEFVNVDRAFLTLISGTPPRVVTRYYWADDGVDPMVFNESLEHFEQMFPWIYTRLQRFESIAISRLDDLPAEAAAEKEVIRDAGIQSVLMVPMIHNNTLIGYTGYDSLRAVKVWSDDVAVLLRIVGEIFANALERKRSEEALRASEEMFRSLTETSPIGIFVVDDDYRFIYVNDQYCRILGYTPEEIIHQDFRMVVPEDNREALSENYRKRQRGEYVPVRYETRLLHKDGSLVWCEASSRVIRDSDGHLRTMGLMVDIQDRKQAEARQLELAVEREKVELLRQFIANVSHDLKTPLSVIDTSLYLIRRSEDPARAAEKLSVIQEQTRILSDYIQDLLMMSRLDYIPQLDLKPVQLDRLADSALRQMRTRIESKNLYVHLELNGAVPPVTGAEDELSRAIGNLLENAINYTPDGGTVRCQFDQQGNWLVVTIADTGIGIHPHDLPHIFDRFYRAEQARSTLSTGSGLGLAIVKKVVDLHQGQIEIDSTPGQGTTCRVRLPVASAGAASS